jgi:Cdc6-like AAA superfamily ATPase
MAFDIVAHHLLEHLQGKNPPQLLMAIHGQGGTGKTCLLQAITSLFSDLGCADLFAKTALTGVAACQMGGKTLHSWATIPAGKGLPRTDTWIHRPSRETMKKRIANMRGKFLFAADEMSLLTTELLYFLSQITSAFRAAEGTLMLHIVNLSFDTLHFKEFHHNS